MAHGVWQDCIKAPSPDDAFVVCLQDGFGTVRLPRDYRALAHLVYAVQAITAEQHQLLLMLSSTDFGNGLLLCRPVATPGFMTYDSGAKLVRMLTCQPSMAALNRGHSVMTTSVRVLILVNTQNTLPASTCTYSLCGL